MNRLNYPNISIPASFADNGQKADFTEDKILNGFDSSEPDILAGDNLNKFIDDTYKGLTYALGSITDLYSSELWYDSTQTYLTDSLVFGKDTNDEVGLYISLADNNLNNPLSDEQYWLKISLGGGGGNSRNIGEIIHTLLPQNDASLHLVDGSIINGGGIYAQFVDYIATLYTQNPDASYFTTETAWQNSVRTYGICAKFVYDSTNNTVRLPKVTGLIEGTIDINAIGELIQAGLPALSGTTSSNGAHTHTRGTMNIKGRLPGENTNETAWWNRCSGAFYQGETTNNKRGNSSPDNDDTDMYFDASRNWTGATSSNGAHTHSVEISDSAGIVGRSSTVQPQAVKGYLYIVISTSVKTNIQVNIDNVVTDLNKKADRDFKNITWTNEMRQIVANVVGDGLINQIATNEVQGIVMPDNETIKVSANGTLSTVADPDDYYTKSEVDAFLQEKNTQISNLNSQISSLQTAISALQTSINGGNA